MSQDPDTKSTDTSREIEREIRANRQFSLNDVIGQIAGGDFMKGGTPVSRNRQAELEVEVYLRDHLVDRGGALRRVLLRDLGEALLTADYEQPVRVLAQYTARVLASEQLLGAVVREADAEWGRVYDERPYFQKPGCQANPDDPYTIDSVRLTLLQLHERIAIDQT